MPPAVHKPSFPFATLDFKTTLLITSDWPLVIGNDAKRYSVELQLIESEAKYQTRRFAPETFSEQVGPKYSNCE
ncbi:hypothetical protein NWI01_30620 [Nitrobacter winogradskyi]|uniref:Uncharacterized protein n=1 Tax=Nitrobacter winogradskyi TaxID=913 RepID=A0A4Y3WGF5_NITWI|nr:hypothetical protein NWI01_30620 [Nitrobacter winogradskyi]